MIKGISAVVLFSHALLALALLLHWFGPATGVGGNFCEAARDALIKQPVNTFSNLAFPLAALSGAWHWQGQSSTSFLQRNTSLSFALLAIVALLGPASMAMHATETALGGYFDMLSMYLIAALVVGLACIRLARIKSFSLQAGLFILLLGICHLFHFLPYSFPLVGFSGNFIFAVFLVLAALLESLRLLLGQKSSVRFGLTAILIMLIAFIIWTTGRDAHPWCRPYSCLQAHAIWHMLNALAAYALYRYYADQP